MICKVRTDFSQLSDKYKSNHTCLCLKINFVVVAPW